MGHMLGGMKSEEWDFRHGGQDPPRELAQHTQQEHPIRDLPAMTILPSPTINPVVLSVVAGTGKT